MCEAGEGILCEVWICCLGSSVSFEARHRERRTGGYFLHIHAATAQQAPSCQGVDWWALLARGHPLGGRYMLALRTEIASRCFNRAARDCRKVVLVGDGLTLCAARRRCVRR